jgi:hypothetical protein
MTTVLSGGPCLALILGALLEDWVVIVHVDEAENRLALDADRLLGKLFRRGLNIKLIVSLGVRKLRMAIRGLRECWVQGMTIAMCLSHLNSAQAYRGTEGACYVYVYVLVEAGGVLACQDA